MKNSIPETISYAIKTVIEFLFGRRTIWRLSFQAGLALAVVALSAGWALNVNATDGIRQLVVAVSTAGGPPQIITSSAVLFAGVLMVIGLIGMANDQRREWAALSRKKVIVIEQRGLRDTTDSPLESAMPKEIQGYRIPVLNDLRMAVNDTTIDPDVAFERIKILPQLLQQHFKGENRRDITVTYGGISPVPLTFLTGAIIDDEAAIKLFDWDRDQEKWRPLDGVDDGDRFQVTGLNGVHLHAPDVIVAVSVSYKVDMPAVRTSKGNMPVVHLDLPNGSTSCHWSEEKQQALAQSFREVMIQLGNKHVGHIHLFIIAPNSLVFRLGRTYDKRNLPPATVYQYERTGTPPHPWGVMVPSHGQPPKIVRHVAT